MLAEQHRDLSQSLAELLDDIFAGRKRLKVYLQFKMYNDPTMNPYLVQAGQEARRSVSAEQLAIATRVCSCATLRALLRESRIRSQAAQHVVDRDGFHRFGAGRAALAAGAAKHIFCTATCCGP